MGINERLIEIQGELKNLKEKDAIKEKKFKFPFGKKVGRAQKKKNYVTVLSVYENGKYDYKKYQILDQTLLHEAIPRLATAGHVLNDKKGNPLIILPNWSVEPFSPLEHYQKSLINGSNTNGYKILMAKMLNSAVGEKKKIGGLIKILLGVGIGGIILYAILTGSGS